MVDLNGLVGKGWFGIISFAGLVVWSLYYFLSPKFKQRHTEYDEAGTGLIALLQKTKEELLEENTKLRKEFNILRADFETMNKEHKLLKEIMQGRDPDSVKFREQGIVAFEQAKHTNDLTVKTHAKVMVVESLVKKVADKLSV